MKLRECLTCGAPLTNEGKCKYCGNTFTDVVPDEISAELSRASAMVRDGEFLKSREILENIISSVNDHNSTVYFQKALAVNEIAYVEDPNNSGKRIPTFWNSISKTPFIEEEDIKLAIRYATPSEKPGLMESIQIIEKLRLKYLDLYKKLPSYDVFISYKDSDLENGIEVTQDSVAARDLYDYLREHGLTVFYSRVSLKDYIGEEYEPVIYHAIQSAKVMIVYGSKVEYISSRWITNEWKRFKYCIQKGEKTSNSLVVLYKDLDPSKLPVALKNVQCIKEGPTTSDILAKHINKVLTESVQTTGLDRIEIKKGSVKPKATKLERKAIKTIDIGVNNAINADYSLEDKFSIVKAYISAREWDRAEDILNELKKDYPDSIYVTRYELMISLKSDTSDGLINNAISERRYEFIPRIIETFPREAEERILRNLYDSIAHSIRSDEAVRVLELIMPYSFDGRDICINNAIDRAIINLDFKVLECLLNSLDEKDVDKYIECYQRYMEATKNEAYIESCISRILEVDPGNEYALHRKVIGDLKDKNKIQFYVDDLESLLSVSDDPDAVLSGVIDYLIDHLNKDNGIVSAQTLRYMNPDCYSKHKEQIISLASLCCKYSLFEEAAQINGIAKTVETDDMRVYENDLLIRTKCNRIEGLRGIKTPLKDMPEFTSLLIHSGSDPAYQSKLVEIESRQSKVEGWQAEQASKRKSSKPVIKAQIIDDPIPKGDNSSRVAAGLIVAGVILLVLLLFCLSS